MAPILRTLCVWLPIAMLPLLQLSVSHIHAVHLALVTASAFGGMRSWRTVVIGPLSTCRGCYSWSAGLICGCLQPGLRFESLFGSGWDPDRVFLAGPSPDLASGEIVGTATACFTPRAHWGSSFREHRVVVPGHGPQPDPWVGSAALA